VPAAPHPATLIAIAALVIASSGGAFAAGSLINGASIKNGSIPGTKLEPHTLSGLQINVARLGTVPLPATLPRRQSLSGLYAVEGTGHVNQSAVSWLIPLASAPTAHFIAPGAAAPSQTPSYRGEHGWRLPTLVLVLACGPLAPFARRKTVHSQGEVHGSFTVGSAFFGNGLSHLMIDFVRVCLCEAASRH